MGCGQTKTRGVNSPRDRLTASDIAWEAKGKIPIVVLKGWAKCMGIPYINPNRRIAHGKKLPFEPIDELDPRPYDMQIAHFSPDALMIDTTHHSFPPNVDTVLPTEQAEELPEQPLPATISPNVSQLAQEDSDSEDLYQGDTEGRRLARLEREKAAEEQAARIAALERETLALQQRAQSEQLDAQTHLAAAIMAKYS